MVVVSSIAKQLLEVGVDDALLEVAPDSFIVAAIVRPTRHGPMLVNRATHTTTVQVMTITIFIARDEIRMTKVPLHDSLLHVLMRKRKT
jgi:hypothetical protein